MSDVHIRYQAYYCEENIWYLCKSLYSLSKSPKVIFISNAQRSVALGSQRAGIPHGYVIWDYHVVLLEDEGSPMLWDLDSTLGYPVKVNSWLAHTFDCFNTLPTQYRARMRVVPGDIYLNAFASDRRHMKDAENNWLQAPPSWAPIGIGHNLNQWIDTEVDGHGECMDLDDFRTRFGLGI